MDDRPAERFADFHAFSNAINAERRDTAHEDRERENREKKDREREERERKDRKREERERKDRKRKERERKDRKRKEREKIVTISIPTANLPRIPPLNKLPKIW
jgi:hypothetical protein